MTGAVCRKSSRKLIYFCNNRQKIAQSGHPTQNLQIAVFKLCAIWDNFKEYDMADLPWTRHIYKEGSICINIVDCRCWLRSFFSIWIRDKLWPLVTNIHSFFHPLHIYQVQKFILCKKLCNLVQNFT
jgi:hypothetical protein